MSVSVPWRELAIGVTALSVCAAIGWWNGAENLKEKKKKGPQGQQMDPQQQEEFELRTLLHLSEQATKKGAWNEVEKAYIRLLEITKESEDPNIGALTPHMHRRLADLYDKMGQQDKAMKYAELVIDEMMSRELTEDEQHTLMIIMERCVEMSSTHAPIAKHEKFLTAWLEVGTKLQATDVMVMAATLLGRLKVGQEKWVEGEGYFRRALKHYTTPIQREELWLSSMASHVQCLTKLEKHDEARKGFKDIADFLLNSENANYKRQLLNFDNLAAEMLTNMGDRCLFLGYYEEAEYIMKSNLLLMKRRKASVNEQAVVDHGLATVWSSTGRLPQARERVGEMKTYLHGTGLFPSYSKYLHTAAVKHEEGQTVVSLYLAKEGTRLLKTGSVLVFDFENPQADQPTIQVEHVVQEGEENIKVTAPVDYSASTGQMYSAEVTIYADSSKTEALGRHFVFIPTGAVSFTPAPTPSPLPLSLPTSSAPAPSSSSTPGTTIRIPNGQTIFIPDGENIKNEEALRALLQGMTMPGDEGEVFLGDGEDDDDLLDEEDEDEDDEEGAAFLEEWDEPEDDDEEHLVLNK